MFWKSKQQRLDEELEQARKEDERAFAAQMPPRPVMAPPSEGTMSVGLQQTQNFVWVWILLTETTKQTLSNVMQEPVDELEIDMSDALREHIRMIKQQVPEDSYERQDEIRKITELFNEPHYVTLEQILAFPYRHPAASAQEAADYIARLKDKILPKVKAMIEAQSNSKTQTFQL